MADTIREILKPSDDAYQTTKIYGAVIGIVTSLKDPDKMGRVKVRFPWMNDKEESWWCRIATLMAGKGRGSWFIPEVDDEVLVVFEHGDVRFPYIVGALWNGKDVPPGHDDVTGSIANPGSYKTPTPSDTKGANKENDLRFIRSRSGHLFIFDDTKNKERIVLNEKTGKGHIQLISKGESGKASPGAGKEKIVITAETGDVEIFAPKGQVYIKAKTIRTETTDFTKMKAGGVFECIAKMNMKHQTDMNLVVKAKMNSDHAAGVNLTMKSGAMMTIKSGAMMQIQAGALMQIKAAAPLICKGAVILLN